MTGPHAAAFLLSGPAKDAGHGLGQRQQIRGASPVAELLAQGHALSLETHQPQLTAQMVEGLILGVSGHPKAVSYTHLTLPTILLV